MAVSLSGRSFLKLLDFTPAEIRYMLELSKEFKRLKLTNTPHRYLQGKNIVLLFEKPLPARAVRSRWPAWTWAWALPSWIRAPARWAKREH